MYAALWRVLPGPVWAKVLQCLALLTMVVVVLLYWVFPWAEPLLPFDQIIIGNE
ncbi:hypothetical protein [Nocardioides yefusunii]|uniref:Uncharacterized protein n=1 Tax=Nocardioides yefusunii TaxID=2500546 RepID=A0ABW1QSC7_9ACTN|nr:hypothetical protein [Nocardioides yefusunii]